MTDIAPEETSYVDFNSRSVSFKYNLNLDMICMGFDVQSINHHVHFVMYILTWYDVSKLTKPLKIRKYSCIFIQAWQTVSLWKILKCLQ
jgi:hypothetical protein